MKMETSTHAAHTLTQLAQQFDHWRQHRTTRAERIPQPLWEQAVALTAVLPLSRVAKCLRISWRDLHQHCVAQDITSTAEAPPAAQGFVELPIAPLSWSLPPLSAAVELHRADGARMRIQTHSSQLPLERLVKTFLETP